MNIEEKKIEEEDDKESLTNHTKSIHKSNILQDLKYGDYQKICEIVFNEFPELKKNNNFRTLPAEIMSMIGAYCGNRLYFNEYQKDDGTYGHISKYSKAYK